MKNSPFNLPGNIMAEIGNFLEIEVYADTINCIIYGKYKLVHEFADILNDFCKKYNLNKKYLVSKLNLPIAKFCDIQQNDFNKKNNSKFKFKFNNSLESIQCIAYADCNSKDAKEMYTILCLEKNDENNFELKYPNIEIKEEEEKDPEDILYKELKKISYPHAKFIRKNMKLIDIAGENDEILVYTCKLNDSGINKEIKNAEKNIEKKKN
jgi:hypothetical protein